MIARSLATKLWLALGLLVGIALGTVVTQAIVERRSPSDVLAGYARPFVASPQSYFHKNRVALLLLGIDYSYDAKDQGFSAAARSDTIKAVALNLPTADDPTGSISLLSVPRDMEYVYPSGRADKINSAYGTGHDSASSARASERAVAQFLGVPGFDRYLTLRIDATKEVVDAIGGIDVVPDETMNYDDSWGHLHIHFIGGRHYHMNGEQAVSYARFRHDACSDPCRIKRQDQIIRITLAKLKNDRFNDLVHVQALMDVVRRNVYTDLSQQEILSLALAFQHVDLKAIRTDQVPYTSDRQLACCGDVLIPDDVAKAKLVAAAFTQPPRGAVASAVIARIHVDVRNGSGVTGQGSRLAASLRKAGFVVDSVSNAARIGYDATEIRVHRTVAPLAGERIRAAIALPGATVEPDPAPASTASSDVTVIVGRDYAASTTDAASPR